MKILLAIDHSPASEAAVRQVAIRPWPAGTSIEVISVVDTSPAWTTSEVMEEAARRAQDLVLRASEKLALSGRDITKQVLSGDPKSAIVDRAGAWGADLIVIGPHGAAGLTQFLLGSVAKAVVRFSPCSVELVRSRSGREEDAPGMKLLLGTDGSEYSQMAAYSVARRPWPPGTEVRVLSAVEYHLPFLQATLEPSFINPGAGEKLREEALNRAEAAIEATREVLSAAGLKTSETLSVLAENPKRVILDEAQRWGADMIVVGSHGHRGIERFLLGSVSESVATHAGCSVEVIRPAAT